MKKVNAVNRRALNKEYRGSNHWNSKLTEDDVRLIDVLLRDGVRESDIARKFEVSRNCINQIALGQRWKHVTGVGI